MSTAADPVAALKYLLEQLLPGSSVAAVPVHADKLQGVPPAFLLQDAGDMLEHRVPLLMPARVALRSYAETDEAAAANWRAARLLLQGVRPVATPYGVIRQVFDEMGIQRQPDPDTRWSVAFGVMDVYMESMI